MSESGIIYAEPQIGEFLEALERLAEETNKSFGEVIRANARLLAINLAIGTQPFSGKEGNFRSGGGNYSGLNDRKLGENAVRRDIGRVYTTVGALYGQIAAKGKEGSAAAKGFYAACQRGEMKLATEIARRFGVSIPIAKFDGGALHQRLRNNRGRISAGTRPQLAVLNPKAVGTYTRKIERNVGRGKGGWAGAAAALGSMRGVPQWVTRHRSGGSVSDRSRTFNDPQIDLHNNVPWVDQILSGSAAQYAVDIQRDKMLRHLEVVIEYNARKAGFSS